MCLLPCRLLEGGLEGCWELVSVHTCLAFSVVDAVNSMAFWKTVSCFYLVLEIQYTFFNSIKKYIYIYNVCKITLRGKKSSLTRSELSLKHVCSKLEHTHDKLLYSRFTERSDFPMFELAHPMPNPASAETPQSFCSQILAVFFLNSTIQQTHTYNILLLFSHWVVSDSSVTTPWTVDRQTPLSLGFPGQEYWSGLPVPSPGDIPNPGIEPEFLVSPAMAGRFLSLSLQESPLAFFFFLMCILLCPCPCGPQTCSWKWLPAPLPPGISLEHLTPLSQYSEGSVNLNP